MFEWDFLVQKGTFKVLSILSYSYDNVILSLNQPEKITDFFS